MSTNVKILIVDDAKAIRIITTTFLKQLGLTNIEEAYDGVTGLSKWKKAKADNEPYDLVITDWVMPNKSGIELVRNIREISNDEQPVIIMLTAEGRRDTKSEAQNSGVNYFIPKPFTKECLRKRLCAMNFLEK